jgi:hypothetical protein
MPFQSKIRAEISVPVSLQIDEQLGSFDVVWIVSSPPVSFEPCVKSIQAFFKHLRYPGFSYGSAFKINNSAQTLKPIGAMAMRVLSVSHDSLPDIRVEKTAFTARKNGHATFFAGPRIRSFAMELQAFEKTYTLPFSRKANLKIPPYWNWLRKSLQNAIEECKPDVIHAHNIIAGRLASEFNIPFVYDDHEYWSVSMKAMKKTKIHHVLSLRYKQWLMERWEKRVLDKASAVITTADTVTEEFRRLNSRVFSVPNFPSSRETKEMQIGFPETSQLSSVYVGSDCTQPKPSPERDSTGLVDLYIRNDVGNLTVIGDNRLQTQPHVNSVGFLPHQKMMNELTRHHIGLLPWKKHWLHQYKHPNKPYQYAHAGLLTFSASDMVNVVASLKEYVKTFEDYESLLKLLAEHKERVDELNQLKPKIRKYALDNLTWEKNEAKILEAYARS